MMATQLPSREKFKGLAVSGLWFGCKHGDLKLSLAVRTLCGGRSLLGLSTLKVKPSLASELRNCVPEGHADPVWLS